MRLYRLPIISLSALAFGLAATSAAGAQGLASDKECGTKIHEALRLSNTGRFEAARDTYQQVAQEQAAAGAYPAAALRGLAHSEFLLGNSLRAAKALDELATHASEFGDPRTQIYALLDAALLHQDLGHRAEVAARAPRIRRLLQSPALPPEVLDDVSRRLVGK